MGYSNGPYMSKADEKAMYAELVEGLPEGYVKTVLADIRLELERAIDSDFGFVSLKDRLDDIAEYRTAMIAARLELLNLQNQTRELEKTRVQLDSAVQSLREKAKAFARL